MPEEQPSPGLSDYMLLIRAVREIVQPMQDTLQTDIRSATGKLDNLVQDHVTRDDFTALRTRLDTLISDTDRRYYPRELVDAFLDQRDERLVNIDTALKELRERLTSQTERVMLRVFYLLTILLLLVQLYQFFHP